MPKWIPKVSPKPRFGRSGVRLLRFLAVFRGMRFLMIFEVCQNRPKMTKVRLGRPKRKPRTDLGRVGGRGGRPGKSFSRGFTFLYTSA